MIVKHFFEGGPSFMSIVYIMWIIVIVTSIRFLLNYFSEKKDLQKLSKQNSTVLFAGSLGFLFGAYGHMLGLYGALNAVEKAGDIAPSLIAGGLRVSLLTVIYGFGLLIVSSIIWFIFKNLIQK